jgi:hypothetical protein
VKSKYSLCIVEREKLVTRYALNLATGQKTLKYTSTEIENCNTPLFGEREKASGVCTSCYKGIEMDGNMPTEFGRQQIAEAQVQS